MNITKALNEFSQSELKELVNRFDLSDWQDEESYTITDILGDLFHSIFLDVWVAAGGGANWYYNDYSSDDMNIGAVINYAISAVIDLHKCDVAECVTDVYPAMELDSLAAKLDELSNEFGSSITIEQDKVRYDIPEYENVTIDMALSKRLN